jgi:hypothetical protein
MGDLGKIFIGIVALLASLLSVSYIMDSRALAEKEDYKNRLLSELSVVSNEELADIEIIRSDLQDCLKAVDSIIEDMADGRRSKDKKQLAEDYLLVSQKMYISFFPQSGSYEQLINSGSLELIESANFRKVLLDTYTHLPDRNDALSRTLDDYYLVLTEAFGKYVTIVPSEMKTRSFVYSNTKVKDFSVDDSFYRSKKHLSVLIETRNLISKYLNLLDRFSESYGRLVVHAKEELNS